MVLMFMLFHIEKSRILFSNVYDIKYNDDNKEIRELYLKEKIIEEYLFLRSIENDQSKIKNNTESLGNILVGHFNEKFHYDKEKIKYEGIIVIQNKHLFDENKIAFWKYYNGYCLTLVCKKEENIKMAQNFIDILIMIVNEGKLSHIDYWMKVIESLLPNGELVFMTVEFARDLIKNF